MACEHQPKMIPRHAFSLVELVIVVAILGTISAIAVPRISGAAAGTRDVALCRDLAVLRHVLDMYAAEHDGALPGADGQDTTLIDQLTKKTDEAGNVGTTAGVHVYGPYLRNIPPVPVGPNAGAIGVLVRNNSSFTVVEDSKGGGVGWVYDYEVGDIMANTDALDKDGTPYSAY